MDINFNDCDKKFKSSFLKELETNIKIIKNLFVEAYIDDKGICYSIDSKIENGRVFCNTSLNSLFKIPENTLLKLIPDNNTECFKKGNTKILGLYIDKNNQVLIRTTEVDYPIGEFQPNKKLNIDYLNEIISNINYSCNLNELLERFDNKEFINIKKDRYDLILTHKLFPMVNKSVNFDFNAKMNDNGTFYGIFRNKIEEKNKKDEITFEMEITYIYRFMDLN